MYILDRFEGDFAVLEGEGKIIFQLPRTLLPQAKEGDILHIAVRVDEEETAKRKRQAQALLDNFFDA